MFERGLSGELWCTRACARFLGMKDEIKGKAEELKGKVTGDKSEEMKGKAHQEMDHARAKARDAKEDVREEWDKHNTHGDENRDNEPGPSDPNP